MKWTPQDLKEITNLTLSHFNQRAEEFWEGTRDHNVDQNIAALSQCIEGEPPFTILDFGPLAGWTQGLLRHYSCSKRCLSALD
jgi:hypothetical protein